LYSSFIFLAQECVLPVWNFPIPSSEPRITIPLAHSWLYFEFWKGTFLSWRLGHHKPSYCSIIDIKVKSVFLILKSLLIEYLSCKKDLFTSWLVYQIYVVGINLKVHVKYDYFCRSFCYAREEEHIILY
jgi:hypothetical protein